MSAPLSSDRRNPQAYFEGIRPGTDELDRFELFLLGDGEKKITWVPETRKQCNPTHTPFLLHLAHILLKREAIADTHDPPSTGVPNAAVFTLNKEDHTIGNLLRHYLIKSPNVLFAAYKIPHPLFATFELRVQTDGELSPKDAVIKACADCVQDLQRLDQEFTKEWELKKIAGQGRMDL